MMMVSSSAGIRALADGSQVLGEVTIVAPLERSERHRPRARRCAGRSASSSCAERHLLRGRDADRLRQPRASRDPRRPARPRRLRHQQGLEHWRRCDVFGHRGGRARGRAAGRSRRLAVSLQLHQRHDYDFSQAARAAASVAERVLADGLPSRTFLNLNVPRAAEGQPA